MGLVFPAQYKLVVILIEVAGQGDQVDLKLLQIVFTADDLFDGFVIGRSGPSDDVVGFWVQSQGIDLKGFVVEGLECVVEEEWFNHW